MVRAGVRWRDSVQTSKGEDWGFRHLPSPFTPMVGSASAFVNWNLYLSTTL
jgi:hypothetical protein